MHMKTHLFIPPLKGHINSGALTDYTPIKAQPECSLTINGLHSTGSLVSHPYRKPQVKKLNKQMYDPLILGKGVTLAIHD